MNDWTSPTSCKAPLETCFDLHHPAQLQSLFPGIVEALSNDVWGRTLVEAAACILVYDARAQWERLRIRYRAYSGDKFSESGSHEVLFFQPANVNRR